MKLSELLRDVEVLALHADADMEITDVRLLEKTGGKSGTFRREDLTWQK